MGEVLEFSDNFLFENLYTCEEDAKKNQVSNLFNFDRIY